MAPWIGDAGGRDTVCVVLADGHMMPKVLDAYAEALTLHYHVYAYDMTPHLSVDSLASMLSGLGSMPLKVVAIGEAGVRYGAWLSSNPELIDRWVWLGAQGDAAEKAGLPTYLSLPVLVIEAGDAARLPAAWPMGMQRVRFDRLSLTDLWQRFHSDVATLIQDFMAF